MNPIALTRMGDGGGNCRQNLLADHRKVLSSSKRSTLANEAQTMASMMFLAAQPHTNSSSSATPAAIPMSGKIFNVSTTSFSQQLQPPRKVYNDFIVKKKLGDRWISAIVSPKYASIDLHHDDGLGYNTIKRDAKLWAIWPPMDENLVVMEEGYATRNIGIAWAKERLKYGILLIQRDGETDYLPACCPHAVLALETGIMWGTDLLQISKMPTRIRWAKALALHGRYHTNAGDQEYVARCFVDQLRSTLHEREKEHSNGHKTGYDDHILSQVLETWRRSREPLGVF